MCAPDGKNRRPGAAVGRPLGGNRAARTRPIGSRPAVRLGCLRREKTNPFGGGHEPLLSQTVSFLLSEKAGANIQLKKGGLCCLKSTTFHRAESAAPVGVGRPHLRLNGRSRDLNIILCMVTANKFFRLVCEMGDCTVECRGKGLERKLSNSVSVFPSMHEGC